MVIDLYEKESRARYMVTVLWDTFCGFMSSDGYV